MNRIIIEPMWILVLKKKKKKIDDKKIQASLAAQW